MARAHHALREGDHIQDQHGPAIAELGGARGELDRITLLDEDQVENLIRHGFMTAQELADADPAEVQGILGGTDEWAESVVKQADEVVEQLIMEEAERRKHGPSEDEALPEEL